jgi:hypothetical protein
MLLHCHRLLLHRQCQLLRCHRLLLHRQCQLLL